MLIRLPEESMSGLAYNTHVRAQISKVEIILS